MIPFSFNIPSSIAFFPISSKRHHHHVGSSKYKTRVSFNSFRHSLEQNSQATHLLPVDLASASATRSSVTPLSNLPLVPLFAMLQESVAGADGEEADAGFCKYSHFLHSRIVKRRPMTVKTNVVTQCENSRTHWHGRTLRCRWMWMVFVGRAIFTSISLGVMC